MGWIENLDGLVVGLDTAPIIYFMERNPAYIDLVRPFFLALQQGLFEAVTSTLTLTEVLVHPYRQGNLSLTYRYSQILLHSHHLTMIAANSEIATEAAQIRAQYRLKTPDAIQVATAKLAGAAALLTNDDDLLPVSAIPILHLDSLLRQ